MEFRTPEIEKDLYSAYEALEKFHQNFQKANVSEKTLSTLQTKIESVTVKLKEFNAQVPGAPLNKQLTSQVIAGIDRVSKEGLVMMSGIQAHLRGVINVLKDFKHHLRQGERVENIEGSEQQTYREIKTTKRRNMKIESTAFVHHHPIPKKYTGDGEDVSPPLSFLDVPQGAKSLALIVDDPDAPRGTFDHWIVWNLPPDTKMLPEGAKVPRQGLNHFDEQRYRGPLPPKGPLHRYFFKAFALDTLIDLPNGSTKEELQDAMEGHILGKTELVGTYQR